MKKKLPATNVATARLRLSAGKLKDLSKLTKSELIAIIKSIRPEAGEPIWCAESEGGNPMWGDKSGVVVGYMDGVDFNYELGGAAGGNRVFPSVADLEYCKPCCQSCGIVEVEVRLRRVIKEENFEEEIEAAMSRPKEEKRERTKKEIAAQRKKIQERRELHLTASQLAKLPQKKIEAILARAKEEQKKCRKTDGST